MKAFFVYIAIAAVSINVVANMAANSADGIKVTQQQRIERLCEVNALYCD